MTPMGLTPMGLYIQVKTGPYGADPDGAFRAATIVGPLNEGKRPFLKIPLLEFHKSW